MGTLLLPQRRLGRRSEKGTTSGEMTLRPSLVAAGPQVVVVLLGDRREDPVGMELQGVGPQVVEVVGLLPRLLIRTMGMVVDRRVLHLLLLLEEDSSMPFWRP